MKRAALLALLSLLLPLATAAQTAPDLILVKGKVWTGEASPQWAEAVAIRGERITAVGKTADITALAGPRTRKIDLRGRLVIPGLNDAHVHEGATVGGFRIASETVDPSWEQIEAALLAARDETTRDQWIVGTIGPTVLFDPTVDRAKLDQVSGGRKVWLRLFTGHASISSSAALRAFRVDDNAADPAGGWFERESGTNRLNGKAWEYAHYGLYRRAANLVSDRDALDEVRTFAAEAAAYGITSVQNMPLQHWEPYAKLVARADIPIRMRIIRFPLDAKELASAATPANLPPRVTVSGTKWILDGTPAERNAATRKEYRAGGKGRLNFEGPALEAIVRQAAAANDQLLVHVSGDRAAAAMLQALDAAGIDWKEKRVRFEHGDGVSGDLVPLVKKHGVVIVQNPSHFEAAGLFPEGTSWQAVKSLLGAGVPFALGSDGPLNPYLNIAWAAAHSGNPGEALTREQAVAAYTLGSAFAEGMEKEKGTIARGKLADIAVLSQDIFRVPAEQLADTYSVLTIVGGKIVHEDRTRDP